MQWVLKQGFNCSTVFAFCIIYLKLFCIQYFVLKHTPGPKSVWQSGCWADWFESCRMSFHLKSPEGPLEGSLWVWVHSQRGKPSPVPSLIKPIASFRRLVMTDDRPLMCVSFSYVKHGDFDRAMGFENCSVLTSSNHFQII